MVSTIISVLLPGQAAVGRGEHGRQTRAEEVQASDAVHPERGEEVETCPGAVSSLVIMLPGARRRGLGRNVPLGGPDAPLRAFQGKFAHSVTVPQ